MGLFRYPWADERDLGIQPSGAGGEAAERACSSEEEDHDEAGQRRTEERQWIHYWAILGGGFWYVTGKRLRRQVGLSSGRLCHNAY